MNRSALLLRAFIGYQIKSDCHRPSDFRLLGRSIAAMLAVGRHPVHFMPTYGELPVGTMLWDSIHKSISACDMAILDISENNPNVLLEAGLACGMHKLVILLRCSKAKDRIPSDINAFVYQPYDKLDPKSVANSICAGIKHYLRNPKERYFYLRHLWSLNPESRTYIVPGNLPGDYGKNPFEDYVRLRNHTDLDSVYLIAETLTRLYPHMTVLIHSASRLAEMPEDWRECNIVLVGGPDYNPVVREFEGVCPLEYKYGGESEVWLQHRKTRKKYIPSFKKDRGIQIASDYGFFLKTAMGKGLPGRLVFIGGARTWGVCGASMLVGCRGVVDTDGKVRNVQRIVQKIGTDPSFIVTVKVNGSSDGIHSPQFRLRDIEPLPKVRGY